MGVHVGSGSAPLFADVIRCACLTDPSSMLGAGKFVVEIRRYDDDESLNYDRREVFGRALPEQVRAAAQFVSDELGTDVLVTGIYRHELPRLPVRVVREAIANAVTHRSYERDRATILVELRPSRVVVTSPGRLPEPVTVATMRQAQAARNPVVIDVLPRFRLAEDAGQGVDVMEDQMRDAMLDPPRFEETADSVRVVLGLLGPVASGSGHGLQNSSGGDACNRSIACYLSMPPEARH